jgi:hypothetical protein
MAKKTYRAVLPVLAGLVICAGCATVPLNDARSHFNSGALDVADGDLASLPHNADRVLYLMERGMIRHLRRDYTNSTRDWLEAVQIEKELETHSASKAGASMLVNDSLLSFRGYPYERTYLHVYLARNYLACGQWDDAAVEARGIVRFMQHLDGFPDDALSHYMTGFCFELCGDYSNAAMQYRETAKLAPELGLDEHTGRFTVPHGSATITPPPSSPPKGSELVCFIDFDGHNGMIPDLAEIYVDGRLLGTTRTLSNLASLESASRQRMETRRAAKTLTRIALKESLSLYASSKNNDLGGLIWLLLFAMEKEDTRRWETLPAKMAVARVECPDNLSEFEVVFKSYSGTQLRRLTVKSPITKKDRIFVSLCRDHP